MSFLQVKCKKCNNDQIIFDKPMSDVKCLVCGDVISKSTGGVGAVEAKIVKKLD